MAGRTVVGKYDTPSGNQFLKPPNCQTSLDWRPCVADVWLMMSHHDDHTARQLLQ